MIGEFRFRQSELVDSRLRQQKSAVPCWDGGSSQNQARAEGSRWLLNIGRREVGDSRLRWREVGGSMPTIRYKEGRLLLVVRDRARRLQNGKEGAWRLQAGTEKLSCS